MTKSTRPMIRIHDLETNEVVDREMNDAEFAEHEADKAAYATALEAKVKAEEDKAALLARLGLTAEEAKLLLQ